MIKIKENYLKRFSKGKISSLPFIDGYGDKNRFIALGILTEGITEFLAFYDTFLKKTHIEEVTNNSELLFTQPRLKQIEDDKLWQKLVTISSESGMIPKDETIPGT